MAYIETLLSTYPQFRLPDILGTKGSQQPLPLAVGISLLEARHCRLDPDHAISFVDRAVMRANAEIREWYEQRYEITQPRRG